MALGEGGVAAVGTGASREEALEVLTDAGYGVAKRDVEVRRARNVGVVVAQSPKAGTRLEPYTDDSVVVLDVGVPRDEDDEEEDDDRGRRRPPGGPGGGGGGDDPEPPPPDDD